MEEIDKLLSIGNEEKEYLLENIEDELESLRRQEAMAKDFSRTLKFNFVECKSKLLFLEALKNEGNFSTLNVEFPTEDQLKQTKADARAVHLENKQLEDKIIELIQKVNNYKNLLEKLPEENKENISERIKVNKKETQIEITVDPLPKTTARYEKMINWYKQIIKSIQVLSGIEVKECKEENENLVLTLSLKFNRTLHPYSIGIKHEHTLDLIFDNNEKLINAKVFYSILIIFQSLY